MRGWWSFLVVLICSAVLGSPPVDEECKWTSLSGASYNLQPLSFANDAGHAAWLIRDGDIPCTPETEPTYSFMWNFCALVSNSSMPSNHLCKARGAAMQYLNRSDGYKECHVIGKYDSSQDDAHFSLLDIGDPSRGVSIKYTAGDKCPSGVLRSATINVECFNTAAEVLSALEPSVCQYHMIMRSYYGCPAECPITSNGLCNSHGHCAYDSKAKQPYCYCNEGFEGADCMLAKVVGGAHSGVYQVQVGLLVVLLVVAVGLIAVVGFMVYKITSYRKEQAETYSRLHTASTHGGVGGGDGFGGEGGMLELQTF